ncbi:MAG: hypothetical protein QOG83_3090 [Alphaproteobacteria bacterium]|nr:hypothetical protein [Alphaproteobacteria bacterium]
MNRCAARVLVVSALALPLAACASFDPGFSIDPGEWFSGDFLNTKRKLPGERKAVFPEGVPGVASGVPAELVKGNQAPPGSDDAFRGPDGEPQPAAEEPKPQPKAAAKPKPKPKPQTAASSRPPTAVTIRRTEQPPAQQQPAPAQQRPAAQWPDAPGGQPSGVQWPDPPPVR